MPSSSKSSFSKINSTVAPAGTVNSAPTVAYLKSAQIPGPAYDSNGNPIIDLPSGYRLYGGMGATITTAKVVNVFVSGGNY